MLTFRVKQRNLLTDYVCVTAGRQKQTSQLFRRGCKVWPPFATFSVARNKYFGEAKTFTVLSVVAFMQ